MACETDPGCVDPKMQRENQLISDYFLRQKIKLIPRMLEPIIHTLAVTAATPTMLCEEAIADISVIKQIVDEMYRTGMNEITRHARETVEGEK